MTDADLFSRQKVYNQALYWAKDFCDPLFSVHMSLLTNLELTNFIFICGPRRYINGLCRAGVRCYAILTPFPFSDLDETW